jgi:type IV pilus assembly protein PilZ
MSNAPPSLAREPRAAIALRVDYQRVNALFSDYTRNLSRGGLFLRTDHPLPVGTLFVFELVAPELDAPLQLAGEVAWSREVAAGGDEPGMGVRFIFDGPDERAAFESRIEGLMVERLGKDISRELMRQRR